MSIICAFIRPHFLLPAFFKWHFIYKHTLCSPPNNNNNTNRPQRVRVNLTQRRWVLRIRTTLLEESNGTDALTCLQLLCFQRYIQIKAPDGSGGLRTAALAVIQKPSGAALEGGSVHEVTASRRRAVAIPAQIYPRSLCVGCVNSEWPGALLLTSGITVISVDWSDWSDSSPRGRNPASRGLAGRGGGREGGSQMRESVRGANKHSPHSSSSSVSFRPVGICRTGGESSCGYRHQYHVPGRICATVSVCVLLLCRNMAQIKETDWFDRRFFQPWLRWFQAGAAFRSCVHAIFPWKKSNVFHVKVDLVSFFTGNDHKSPELDSGLYIVCTSDHLSISFNFRVTWLLFLPVKCSGAAKSVIKI